MLLALPQQDKTHLVLRHDAHDNIRRRGTVDCQQARGKQLGRVVSKHGTCHVCGVRERDQEHRRSTGLASRLHDRIARAHWYWNCGGSSKSSPGKRGSRAVESSKLCQR